MTEQAHPSKAPIARPGAIERRPKGVHEIAARAREVPSTTLVTQLNELVKTHGRAGDRLPAGDLKQPLPATSSQPAEPAAA